jgi:hypothetical protein
LKKINLKLNNYNKLLIVSFILFALVGSYLIINTFANTNTTTFNTNYNGTAPCGKRVSNYNYSVPFGNAIWNQPICGKPRHPKSSDYVNRFIEWGHVNDGSASADVNNGKIRNNPGYPDTTEINPLGKLFTREVYYASKSTTERRIGTVSYYSNLDREGDKTFTPNATIPWNPQWEASQGGDNEMIIIDDRPGATQGRLYYLSGYYPENPKFPYRKTPPIGCLSHWSSGRLCTYRTSVARDLNGNYIDYRTYEGFIKDRGVGLSFLATLTLPEEVAAGEIRHALGISMPNTAYGPICTKEQQGTAAEGFTCGTAVAPATKFEWGSATKPPVMAEPFKSLYSIDKTIPEGMLFAIDITDAQIESWISSRTDLKSNPRRAETARIFARAMRDYGMMVVDTNGSRPSIQQAGGINPDNAEKWANLGMGPTEKDNMLDGLVTKNNLYVVDPPTVKCTDGTTSKYFCEWTSASYDTSVASQSPTGKVGDLNNDNKVDILDLSRLLSLWDPNATKPKSYADINGDNKVDVIDMSTLLSNWGK